MDDEQRLKRLAELAARKELKEGFPSQQACIAWANEVGRLIGSNHPYSAEFAQSARIVNTLGLPASLAGSAVNNLVRIVHQVIGDLESAASQQTHPVPGDVKLRPPEEITLKWLWEHVPGRFWIWLVGLLVGAVALGIKLGRTSLVNAALNEVLRAVGLGK